MTTRAAAGPCVTASRVFDHHDWVKHSQLGGQCRRWLCANCGAEAEEPLEDDAPSTEMGKLMISLEFDQFERLVAAASLLGLNFVEVEDLEDRLVLAKEDVWLIREVGRIAAQLGQKHGIEPATMIYGLELYRG